MSSSWVDPDVANVFARGREQRFVERLLVELRAREGRLREPAEDVWRRSGWAETALNGSRTLGLT